MYKAVRNINGTLVSGFSNGECQVVYPVGEKVKSRIPGTKLFAWDTLEQAKLWVSLLTEPDVHYEIWEVMSETPHIVPNRISIYSHDRDGIVDFWNGFGKTKKPWPGTVWVDSLVMVRRVA